MRMDMPLIWVGEDKNQLPSELVKTERNDSTQINIKIAESRLNSNKIEGPN